MRALRAMDRPMRATGERVGRPMRAWRGDWRQRAVAGEEGSDGLGVRGAGAVRQRVRAATLESGVILAWYQG